VSHIKHIYAAKKMQNKDIDLQMPDSNRSFGEPTAEALMITSFLELIVIGAAFENETRTPVALIFSSNKTYIYAYRYEYL
jgi:hypothetical protein